MIEKRPGKRTSGKPMRIEKNRTTVISQQEIDAFMAAQIKIRNAGKKLTGKKTQKVLVEKKRVKVNKPIDKKPARHREPKLVRKFKEIFIGIDMKKGYEKVKLGNCGLLNKYNNKIGPKAVFFR